ncbi:MAG: 50S ribosomal protein L15 [Candidatus Komeilibacteria bacterium]|nr:50S ribosomal protein L15 [Candidatus Komeilibacteria bacterium]
MSMLGLHNLKTAPGSKKRKLRLGRGNASGKGNYSGKGGKGQRARASGKKGLVLKGVKTYIRRIPKKGGFLGLQIRPAVLNLLDLDRAFLNGETVTNSSLAHKGLINDRNTKVKILGSGVLSKKLTVKLQAFSETAKDAIVKAGGTAEIISRKLDKNQLKQQAKKAQS